VRLPLLLVALLAAVSGCPGSQPAKKPEEKPQPSVVVPVAPKGPPKRLFARKLVSRIRDKPEFDARQRGYLRAGTLMTAKSADPISYDRCRRGWFEIAETGGFVCDGREVSAFEQGADLPDRQPTAADRKAALPYRYAYNRGQGTPMYKRLPTEEEALFWEDGVLPPDASVPEAPEASDAGSPEEPTGPAKLADLQGERGALVRRKLARGFHVSLDREFETPTRRYWRSMSNGYIPYARMVPIEGSGFHGVDLKNGSLKLPIAFVVDTEVAAQKEDERGRLVGAGQLLKHESFAIGSERQLKQRNHFVLPDGRLIRADLVTRIDPAPRPAGVAETERWIDIDLAQQTLVAYEGDLPVYATLVSTGRVRNERNPAVNHETPTGRFRILSKHVSATMDGDHAVFGAYSLEDVPYVQFFRGAFAMHGAFWHDKFGRPASHGCINLAPSDALWLFDWTKPDVPSAWHAAYPERPGEGSWLIIHGKTPRG